MHRSRQAKKPMGLRKREIADSINFRAKSAALARAATDSLGKGLAAQSRHFLNEQAAKLLHDGAHVAEKGDYASEDQHVDIAAPIEEAGLLSTWASRSVPDVVFQAPEDGKSAVESLARQQQRTVQAAVAKLHCASVEEVSRMPGTKVGAGAPAGLATEDAVATQDIGTGKSPGPRRARLATALKGSVAAPPEMAEYLAGVSLPGDQPHKVGERRTTLNTLKRAFLYPFNAKEVIDSHHRAMGRQPAHTQVKERTLAASLSGAVGPEALSTPFSTERRTIQDIIFFAGGKGQALGSATDDALAHDAASQAHRAGGDVAQALHRSQKAKRFPSPLALAISQPLQADSSVFDVISDDHLRMEDDERREGLLLRAGTFLATLSPTDRMGVITGGAMSEAMRSSVFGDLEEGESLSRASLSASRPTVQEEGEVGGRNESSRGDGHARSTRSSEVGTASVHQAPSPASVVWQADPEHTRGVAAAPSPETNKAGLQHRFGAIVADIIDASISNRAADHESVPRHSRDDGAGFGGTQAGAVAAIRYRLKAAVEEVVRKGEPEFRAKTLSASLREFSEVLPWRRLFPSAAPRNPQPEKKRRGSAAPGPTASLIHTLKHKGASMVGVSEVGVHVCKTLTSEAMCDMVQLLARIVYWKVIRAEADGEHLCLARRGSERAAPEAQGPIPDQTSPSGEPAMNLEGEGELSTKLLEAWDALHSNLLARGGAYATTGRALLLLTLKGCTMLLLEMRFPAWFDFERSVRAYWSMYRSPYPPGTECQGGQDPAGSLRGASPQALGAAREEGMPSQDIPLALQEARRIGTLKPFRVPRMTHFAVQLDSYVARMLDPGRFGSSIAALEADDDGRAAAASNKSLHQPGKAFSQALFGLDPPERESAKEPPKTQRTLPTSPVVSLSGDTREPAVKVPIPYTGTEIKVSCTLGSPHAPLPLRQPRRHNRLHKWHPVPSSGKEEESRGEWATWNSPTRRGSKGLHSLPPAMSAILPLPPPKSVLATASTTTAATRASMPTAADASTRRFAFKSGQRFNSRKQTLHFTSPIAKVPTSVLHADESLADASVLGDAAPRIVPVRHGAGLHASTIIRESDTSDLSSSEHLAGFLSPESAGVPVSLLSVSQRARLQRSTLRKALQRYRQSAVGNSATSRQHADRVAVLEGLLQTNAGKPDSGASPSTPRAQLAEDSGTQRATDSARSTSGTMSFDEKGHDQASPLVVAAGRALRSALGKAARKSDPEQSLASQSSSVLLQIQSFVTESGRRRQSSSDFSLPNARSLAAAAKAGHILPDTGAAPLDPAVKKVMKSRNPDAKGLLQAWTRSLKTGQVPSP